MTNAVKAQIVVAANAILALIDAFGASLSDSQRSAVVLAINALLGVWIALTYKSSPRRTPDPAPRTGRRPPSA